MELNAVHTVSGHAIVQTLDSFTDNSVSGTNLPAILIAGDVIYRDAVIDQGRGLILIVAHIIILLIAELSLILKAGLLV